MDDTRSADENSSPRELLILRSTCTAFLHMLSEASAWAEQTADVNRLTDPEFTGQLDELRDHLTVAARANEQGTPAAIERVVNELLGEAQS